MLNLENMTMYCNQAIKSKEKNVQAEKQHENKKKPYRTAC